MENLQKRLLNYLEKIVIEWNPYYASAGHLFVREYAIAYLPAKIERIESTIGSQDNKIVALEAIVIGLPTTFISTKQVEAIFDRAISPLLPRLEATGN